MISFACLLVRPDRVFGCSVGRGQHDYRVTRVVPSTGYDIRVTALLKSRVEVLVTIAERYQELVEPAGSNGLPGSGEHVPLMPRTYTATVRAFESLYRVCPARSSVLGWFMGPTRTTWGCPECGQPTGEGVRHIHRIEGKPRKVDRVRIVVKHREAGMASLAESGILWMAEEWCWPFEPMRPDEIMVAA